MKKIALNTFSILLLLAFFTGCSLGDDVTETNYDFSVALHLQNVPYGSDISQTYDVYLPAGRSPQTTKVILLIHGGGWTSGDKSDMGAFLTMIQQNHPDHAIINTNYVLAALGTPAFPNQFLDIKTVIEKITAEAGNLGIKPEFGLIGVSAGAHIAMMYDYVYDVSNQVKFVANVVGPADFTDPFYAEDPNFNLALSLLVDEDAYPPGTDYAEATSPVFQVSANSSPTFLFYGDQDPLVPLSNGQRLSQELDTYEIESVFTVYEGGHGDDWSTDDKVDLQQKITAYINTYLAL